MTSYMYKHKPSSCSARNSEKEKKKKKKKTIRKRIMHRKDNLKQFPNSLWVKDSNSQRFTEIHRQVMWSRQ